MGQAVKAVAGAVLVFTGVFFNAPILVSIGWGLMLGAPSEAMAPPR